MTLCNGGQIGKPETISLCDGNMYMRRRTAIQIEESVQIYTRGATATIVLTTMKRDTSVA